MHSKPISSSRQGARDLRAEDALGVEFDSHGEQDRLELFKAASARGTDAASRYSKARGEGLVTCGSRIEEQGGEDVATARLHLCERLMDEVLTFPTFDQILWRVGVVGQAIVQFGKGRQFLAESVRLTVSDRDQPRCEEVFVFERMEATMDDQKDVLKNVIRIYG